MASDYTIIDHSSEVLAKIKMRIYAGLEACGVQCQSYADQNIAKGTPRHAGVKWYRVEGGSGLRGSLGHMTKLVENAVYIGTNNDHAIYNEYGTGKYAEGGKGRKGWWVYVPGEKYTRKGPMKTYTKAEALRLMYALRAKGLDAHATEGMTALHFLKNAVADHKEQYIAILNTAIKG